METFHLYHLAHCWSVHPAQAASPSIPLTTAPVRPVVSRPTDEYQDVATQGRPLAARNTVIRAAAVHLVFASRTSQDFITPQEVSDLEEWAGLVRQPSYILLRATRLSKAFSSIQGVLTALAAVEISEDVSSPCDDLIFPTTHCIHLTALAQREKQRLGNQGDSLKCFQR